MLDSKVFEANNTFQEVNLTKGVYMFDSLSSNIAFSISADQEGSILYPSTKTGQVYVNIKGANDKVYIKAFVDEGQTATIKYTRDIRYEGAGFAGVGGGGGVEYAFQNPLRDDGGAVSILTNSDDFELQDATEVGEGLQKLGLNQQVKTKLNEVDQLKENEKTLQTKTDSRFSFTSQMIFKQGVPIQGMESLTDNPYYRIPAMCVTSKGTILCFGDYRKTPQDQVGIEIACARSTDGGLNWTYKKAVSREGTDPNSRVMDSTCLATKSGKVFVLAGSWSSGTSNWTQVTSRDSTWKAILAVSTDDGVTWNQNQVQFTAEKGLPSTVNAFLGGVGSGIQMNDGTLVFPVQFTSARGTVSSGMIYSKDDGSTWNWATGSVAGMSENNIFEDLEGNLVSVCRKDPNTGNARGSYITSDMGTNWSINPILNDRIKSPSRAGCEGSSIFFITKRGVPVLLMTAPQNTQSGTSAYFRDRITLYASNNTFSPIQEVFVLKYQGGTRYPDPSSGVPYGGYSCLAYYNGDDGERLFCLFEDSLGLRLTDLTPLIAEIENLFVDQRELATLATAQQQLSLYVRDSLLTEYAVDGFHKGTWLDRGNFLPLNVFNSRGEVLIDPNNLGMIKFANTQTGGVGDLSNYVYSEVLKRSEIINTPNVSFDFDVLIPSSQISQASNYINIFITNRGDTESKFCYGLLFKKPTGSENLTLNPVGTWGNSDTFQIERTFLDKPFHVTMSYANREIKIYINGVEKWTKTWGNDSTYLVNAKRLVIGNSQNRKKIGAFSLGNFKIYTKTLSAEEAMKNYKASIHTVEALKESVDQLKLEYETLLQTIQIQEASFVPTHENVPEGSICLIKMT